MSYTLESLSSGIFVSEFDSDSDLTTQVRVSGWLEANVGGLNSYIYTSFDSDLSCVDCGYDFGHEEASIFTQMYMRNYYSKAATKTLLGQSVSESGSSTTSITGMSQWTKIQEGDTTIERQPLYTTSSSSSSGGLDISKISQRYKDLLDATSENLSEMVARYNIDNSSPSQVSGLDGE
jgi:hypothetical protein